MSSKTGAANTQQVEKPVELPPFIKDDDHYILTEKKSLVVEAVEGLGFGWGLAVGVGIVADLMMGLMKPKGTPDRFKNLVLSGSTWRQALDGAGMAGGAILMTKNAIEHNKKIDSYAEKIQAEKIHETEPKR